MESPDAGATRGAPCASASGLAVFAMAWHGLKGGESKFPLVPVISFSGGEGRQACHRLFVHGVPLPRSTLGENHCSIFSSSSSTKSGACCVVLRSRWVDRQVGRPVGR